VYRVVLRNSNLKIDHKKVHENTSVLPQELTECDTNDEIIQNDPEGAIKPYEKKNERIAQNESNRNCPHSMY